MHSGDWKRSRRSKIHFPPEVQTVACLPAACRPGPIQEEEGESLPEEGESLPPSRLPRLCLLAASRICP